MYKLFVCGFWFFLLFGYSMLWYFILMLKSPVEDRVNKALLFL